MRYLAVVGLLVFLPATSPAQEQVGPGGLRVFWDAAAPASGLQAVCGRVLNDGNVDARRVRVRVEALDDKGTVTARRDGDVLGQVSSRGIGRFCLSMAASTGTFRVTIISVDWVPTAESP
jgi:hypothetical protein